MKRWILVLTVFVLTAVGLVPASRADELAVRVPADAKFLLHLDVQAFRATALGGKLIDLAKSKAEQELSAGARQDKPAGLDKIHEMLGFDPFTDIHEIFISASSYERPEQAVLVSIAMGKSTGNLEGLILALPGYAAEEYGKYTIHSASPDQGTQVFGAIHTNAKGDNTILLAAQRKPITQLLDQLEGKSDGDGSFKTVTLAHDGKAVLQLEILQLPTDLIGEGPQTGVVKVLRTVSLRVTEVKGDLNVGISLVAGSEQQAEQLRQMAQGLIAMIDFAQSANPEDQDLKKVQQLVHDLKADRDGASLKVNVTVPAAELNKVIDDELGDH